VFLVLFWYVNVELEVGKPTNLAMPELVTKLRKPSTTHEPIECLSKVLDGAHVACGLGIGKGLHVVFRVSFSIAIMSLVLTFKSWKLNYDILISFCTTSRIWSWHSISYSVANYVFSWYTCTPGTQKFDALAACGVVVSSPLPNKVRSSSMLRGRKDCGMIAQTPLTLVIGLEPDANSSVWNICLVVETLGATLASCAAK
jgi:hypothetical protein